MLRAVGTLLAVVLSGSVLSGLAVHELASTADFDILLARSACATVSGLVVVVAIASSSRLHAPSVAVYVGLLNIAVHTLGSMMQETTLGPVPSLFVALSSGGLFALALRQHEP